MKTSTKTVLMILGFLTVGLLFGYTVGSIHHSDHRSEEIVAILNDTCECKEVNQIIYATGIQFGDHGITTEKGEYQLIDCLFTSITEEAEKLHAILKQKVKGYDKIDLLELEFINNNQSKEVIIKSGKIQ